MDSPSAADSPAEELRRRRWKRERISYIIMLPSPGRTHAVVEVLSDTSIRLPRLPACSHYYLRASVKDLEDLIETCLGIKVRFVRELWATDGKEKCTMWEETFDFVAVLLVEWAEAQKSVESEKAMISMSVDEMRIANWVEAEKELGLDMRNVVLETMKEINGEVEVRMPPWRRMGWFTKLISWVKNVANSDIDGQKLYRSFVKMVDNQRSVVWVCKLDLSQSKHSSSSESRVERVFIKAALPLLGEAQQTVTIARILEKLEAVPEVIAIREEGHVFIQRDGGPLNTKKKSI